MAHPFGPAPTFPSILCGADHGAAGVAAQRQATWLADREAAMEIVPAGALTQLDPECLARRCAAHDLLVLPSTPEAHRLAPRVVVRDQTPAGV